MSNPNACIGLYSKQFHNHTRRGVAVYSHELVHGLAKVLSETKVYLFDCFWPRENFEYLPDIVNANFETKVLRCPGRIFEALNKNIGWPRLESLAKELNLIHFMHEEFPETKIENVVMTVHDLGPLIYPELFTSIFRDKWLKALDRGIARAVKVVGVSETVRKQLCEHRPEYKSKYESTFLGVSEEFLAEPNPEKEKAFLASKGIDYPYVLYIGAADPKKNLLKFLEAFAVYVNETKPTPPQQLVLVGNKNWGGYEEFEERIAKYGLKGRIHFTGYVDHYNLPALYRGCDLFVFPALFEGFGLPLLEAMACGAPCLSSNRPSLDEVGADVAVFCDPESVDDMSNKLKSLFSDPSKMEDMRIRGPEYAKKFTWERTARKTIQVYEDILGCSLT